MTQGVSLKLFTKKIHLFCQAEIENEAMAEFIKPLIAANKEWGDLTVKLGMAAMKDRNEVGAASVDYLMYAGYVTQAYFYARAVKVAQNALAGDTSETDFYEAKLFTARFFFARLLPRTQAHASAMLAGADTLQGLHEEHFRF